MGRLYFCDHRGKRGIRELKSTLQVTGGGKLEIDEKNYHQKDTKGTGSPRSLIWLQFPGRDLS